MPHLKYSYLLLLLFAFSAKTFAQKLVWSEDVRGDDYNYFQILGADEDGHYTLKSNMPLNSTKQTSFLRKREYHVIYYDTEMRQRWAKTLSGWNKDVRVERVLYANFKPTVFFSWINKDTKKVAFYVQTLNNKGVFEGEPLKLMELPYDKKSDIENIELFTSRDQTKIAGLMAVKTEVKERLHYRAFVINENLETLWDKEFSLMYNKKRIEPLGYGLSSAGDLNILAIKYKTDDQERKAGEFNYTVFMLNPVQEDSLTGIDILVDGKTLTDVSFAIDNVNKKIVLAGFYAGKSGYSAAGTFYANIDKAKGELQNVHTQAFSEDFLLKFLGEKKANNGKELLNYTIDKIVLRNDGGALVTAEAFFTNTTSYYDIFTHSYISRINYNYNNVMVMSINPDGSIDWDEVIPKTQTSTEDGGFYSSYCSLTYQDRIFYVYNDFSGRRNRVVLHTITTKGVNTKTDLLTESNETILVSKLAKQIDDNVLLLPAEKNGKFHYLKIVF